MRLYLMRHGKAIQRGEPNCPPEAERFLTPEGVKKTREAAQGLRGLGADPDLILSSPYLRALQTAEIAAQALEYTLEKIRRTDALLPEASPGELYKELSRLKAGEVLCCGHAPNIDLLISYALGARNPITALKKAGVAELEIESFSPARGILTAVYGVKTLRLLGA